jgi:hypothetical protein
MFSLNQGFLSQAARSSNRAFPDAIEQLLQSLAPNGTLTAKRSKAAFLILFLNTADFHGHVSAVKLLSKNKQDKYSVRSWSDR